MYKKIAYPVSCPTATAPQFKLPEKYVLFAGSICQLKGALDIGYAAKSFLKRNPDLSLVMAGPDCADNGVSVVDKIRCQLDAGSAERLIHVGHLDRALLMHMMQKAMIFVFPSLADTFGFVTAESMLHGVPVIVANAGGAPEFVTHGQTGLIVSPRSPEEIAHQVQCLVDNDA